MSSTGRIGVIGESLVDVVLRTDGSVERHPGGSPMNVAIGLQRLGQQADLVTRYGDDADGELVAQHIASNDVTLLVDALDDQPTSVAQATLDASGGATYEFQVSWDVPPGVESDGHLAWHTGSIAAVLEPGARAVRTLLEAVRATATVTYDPNYRPSLMGDAEEVGPVVESLVRLADVVKVSEQDLAGLYPGQPAAAVAREWLSYGPALVVVTLGADGAWAVCADDEVTRDALPGPVVDTVGAGDAFMAGLIDGLARRELLGGPARTALRAIEGAVLGELLDDAGLVASLTVARAGANPPTADDVAAAR